MDRKVNKDNPYINFDDIVRNNDIGRENGKETLR